MTASQFSLSRLHESVDRDDFKPKRPAGMSRGAVMAIASAMRTGPIFRMKPLL